MYSPLEQFEAASIYLKLIEWVTSISYIFCDDDDVITFITFFDITLFNIIIPLIWLSLLIILFTSFSRLYNLIFTTVTQRLLEYSIKFILNLIKQQIGLFGYPYFVLIYGLFFSILLLNLLSLLPFGIALTSHLIIILYLSLSLCLGIFFEGYIRLGDVFYKIFLPSSPIIMLPLLLLIELFSYIIRMFSLAIRLVANIMAGHTLIYIISTFSLMIYSINISYIFLGIFLICIIMLLELGVACLQAYVFTILILIYINDIYGGSH